MKTHIMPILSLFLLCLSSSALAILPDQIDDFQTDGNIANWTGGNQVPPAPAHVANGGPGGLGDGFLQIGVSGFHLGTYNTAQWAGDYIAAGVTSIELDVNRIAGPDDISLRILLFGPGGTWASANLVPVLPTGNWQHISFGLDAADLVYVPGSLKVPDGTGVLADTLANVERLLIRHDSAVPTVPGNHPPHISATLGIDNITAVPEPSTISLLFVGASLLCNRRGRSKSR